LASAKVELQKEASDRASLTEGHRAELEKRNGAIAKLTEQLVDAEAKMGQAVQVLDMFKEIRALEEEVGRA
jgi:hypothetical protein